MAVYGKRRRIIMDGNDGIHNLTLVIGSPSGTGAEARPKIGLPLSDKESRARNISQEKSLDAERPIWRFNDGSHSSRPSVARTERRRTPTALIVDDAASARKHLRMILQSAGCDVVGDAMDGETAVALSMELKPDLILMDVSLQGMDGIEITRRIKNELPLTRILALSQHALPSNVVDCIKAGASNFIPKPVDDFHLFRIIHNMFAIR